MSVTTTLLERHSCMRLLSVFLVLLAACENPFSPHEPEAPLPGAFESAALPDSAAARWAQVEACSGLHRAMTVQWWRMDSVVFHYNGEKVLGLYQPYADRITLSALGWGKGDVVRHEMLHALGGEHGDRYFRACASIVSPP